MKTNHRGGWMLVRATWLSWMEARGFFFVLAFLWMIPPLTALFVWSAAADSSGSGMVAGMDRGAFAAYYLALIVVNQLTYAQTNWTVGDVIRMGGLTPWLLRPIPPVYHILASEMAGKVVFMVFVIPGVALLALVLKPQMAVAPWQIALFLPALGLAWLLRFCWGLWLAEIAFWATRADSLLVVQDSLVFLLSGMVAPVALLPGGMSQAAALLPFRYMLGFPVEILTGQLSPAAAAQGLLVQALWTALALALAWCMWREGVKRYTAVGG